MIVDILGWLGIAGAVIGLLLSWSRWVQTSLACTAFAGTFLGLSYLLDNLRLGNVIVGTICFTTALVAIVMASIKERKKHGKSAVDQEQDHGGAPEEVEG